MKISSLLLGAVLAAASALALAQDAIRIERPWARPTVSGQPAGGGFLVLHNRATTADRLLSASTPAAERVELHSMKMEGDVMRMRQIDAIDLPAGATVKLEPGGLHLMFMGLKAPLTAGSRVPLTLRFEKAGEVRVDIAVESPTAMPDHGDHKH